jgi:hypothetical protein
MTSPFGKSACLMYYACLEHVISHANQFPTLNLPEIGDLSQACKVCSEIDGDHTYRVFQYAFGTHKPRTFPGNLGITYPGFFYLGRIMVKTVTKEFVLTSSMDIENNFHCQ